jgi:hypothetical protein
MRSLPQPPATSKNKRTVGNFRRDILTPSSGVQRSTKTKIFTADTSKTRSKMPNSDHFAGVSSRA